MTSRLRTHAAANRQFTRRGLMLGLGQAALLGGLAARLYQLQVLEAAETAVLAEGNRTRRLLLVPKRGRILDASGEVLATNREVFQVVLQPRGGLDSGVLRAELKRLAPLIGLSDDEQDRLVLVAGLRGRDHPLLLADNLSFDQVASLQVRSLEFPFLSAQSTWRRVYDGPNSEGAAYPRAHVMAHIIGTVGAVDHPALDDDPILRLAEVRVGKSGVEGGLEGELKGRAGESVYEVDAHGRQTRLVKQTIPRDGRDVVLSIDARLQAQVMERLGQDQHKGAVVILDVTTGEIRAMVSTPSYDPAILNGSAKAAAWQAVMADKDRPLLNRAIAGVYPPGSTFKLVTALAALRAGVIDPKEKIECWGDVTYSGHLFRCWDRKGHKASNLHKALRESCDCYFYEAARRVGMDAIAGVAHELGLGQTYPAAGIAQQKPGLIPSSHWKRMHNSQTGWLVGETVLSGIGQGYVLTTPLQLAVMTARVATGRAVLPTFIKQNLSQTAPEFAKLAIADAALEAVRQGMVAVVNEPGGTGQAADLDDVHTVVAGKSGTAQVSALSADHDLKRALSTDQRDHAVFVAYAPAAAPRYAISVLIEHAGGGGANAAPVARDCLRLLFNKAVTVPIKTPGNDPTAMGAAPQKLRSGPAVDRGDQG